MAHCKDLEDWFNEVIQSPDFHLGSTAGLTRKFLESSYQPTSRKDTNLELFETAASQLSHLAEMLSGNMEKYPSQNTGMDQASRVKWRYVALLPDLTAENSEPTLRQWAQGRIAWFTTQGAYADKEKPKGFLNLDWIDDVKYEREQDDGRRVVIMFTKDKNNRSMAFLPGSMQQAMGWQTNLLMFLKILRKELCMEYQNINLSKQVKHVQEKGFESPSSSTCIKWKLGTQDLPMETKSTEHGKQVKFAEEETARWPEWIRCCTTPRTTSENGFIMTNAVHRSYQ